MHHPYVYVLSLFLRSQLQPTPGPSGGFLSTTQLLGGPA
jgi:hypothetical protein